MDKEQDSIDAMNRTTINRYLTEIYNLAISYNEFGCALSSVGMMIDFNLGFSNTLLER